MSHSAASPLALDTVNRQDGSAGGVRCAIRVPATAAGSRERFRHSTMSAPSAHDCAVIVRQRADAALLSGCFLPLRPLSHTTAAFFLRGSQSAVAKRHPNGPHSSLGGESATEGRKI